MKVLWITNILFPEAQSLLVKGGGVKFAGGWMIGAAEALTKETDCELIVATVSSLVSGLTWLNGNKIRFVIIPKGKGNDHVNHDYEKYWTEVKKKINPDVVHIHGTEFSHGLAYVEACGSDKVVVSIQGLTSVYSRYYNAGLNLKQIYMNFSIQTLLKGGLKKEQRKFFKRGIYEIDLLRRCNNFIGRTSWDRAHLWAVNPKANYFFCNETLRKEFYSDSWSYENCDKHSIFLSQSGYAIKGLHQILKALPIILYHYPDVKVRIAGFDITRKNCSFVNRLFRSTYGRVIEKMISKNKLGDHVFFSGALDADGMKKEYLKSNIFVCPSSIENSPNSLGEAQLLGVPCIASYVGGVMDMIPNTSCGLLYRFDEVEMLAMKICELFESSKKFDNVEMRTVARNRHNAKKNAEILLDIYKTITLFK